MGATRPLFACLLGLLVALAAGGVRADSSALITFSGLEVVLFDLAPGDGIDPVASLTQLERSGAVFQYQSPDPGWPPLREQRVDGLGTAALSDANGNATAVLGDEAMEGEAVTTGSGAFTALLTDSFRFTLTPYTRVIFSALTESALDPESPQAALAVVTLEGSFTNLGESVTFETSSVRLDAGRGAVPLAVETA